ncbi:MAG TPA: hypothetical protein VFW38_08830 [Solirubrobacteraceae bacterium]|nr:hypothetical protein [Solirubrobacteraceae bacterium]
MPPPGPNPPVSRVSPGIIRERQLSHSDILIVLGGGAGVEHLAELYWREGKPVVPVWARLGAFNIELEIDQRTFTRRRNLRGQSTTQARIAYRGPNAPRGTLTKLKLDLTSDEVLVNGRAVA